MADLSGLPAGRAAWGFTGVYARAQLFSGLEEGNGFLIDGNRGPGPGVAPGACIAVLDSESTKPPKFDALASSQRITDFFEDRGNDGFHILRPQVRIGGCQLCDQFRFGQSIPLESASGTMPDGPGSVKTKALGNQCFPKALDHRSNLTR